VLSRNYTVEDNELLGSSMIQKEAALRGIRGQAEKILGSSAVMVSARRRLPIVILANALLRIAGGASGILVGLFLSLTLPIEVSP